ncbi:hydroxypyruvate isomerase family protein [Pelagovum pacificum]|uniref:TIM barrel protein n=1 Tax=Pelagovum pacificum TaxID=2588711 RepID=A0A5C5GHM2_9RHOB|nr:TIM barrel protein [Pelagovum pacificum]QQA43473.1 TIM barrel protein [Pelagovum pacificum]TNY33391.1 TIM barrel protein [Pelagovum pacificum]
MPRFCANLSLLFTDLPMVERVSAAAAAGFEAVEILFPYEENAAELSRALKASRLKLALINAPPPNYADPEGPRGFAAVPAAKDRFRSDFRRTLRYAETLGVERIHLMAGVAEGADAAAVFADNLAWAAATAPNRQLTIEPINSDDMPGYFLDDFAVAVAVLQDIGAPNLSLQFDAYHAHRIIGDVIGTWNAVAPLVGHVQVADFPGRHEPGTGVIDFPGFFAAIDASGYDGWVSAEYHPLKSTEAGLGWRKI